MSNIRVGTISVDSITNQPLQIKNGKLQIDDKSKSFDSLSGCLLTNGGVGINSTYSAISSTSGGALTVAGGVAITKNLILGNNFEVDNNNSIFKINGISKNRLFLNSSSNPEFYISPDGVNTRFTLTDTSLQLNFNTISSNSSTGSLVSNGGISINNSTNSTSISNGGALTVSGGASIGKTLYVGQGINSVVSSNTIGNIFTTTSGNIGIATTNPLSSLSISPFTQSSKITLYDIGDDVSHFGFGVSNNQLNYHVRSVLDNHVFYREGKNGNGVELMRITGNGRLGLGISSPLERLHISGNLKIDNGSFYLSESSNILIFTNGNLGIGTSSPQYSIHINKSNPSIYLESSNNTRNSLLINDNSSLILGNNNIYKPNIHIIGGDNSDILSRGDINVSYQKSVNFDLVNGNNISYRKMVLTSSGNLGIGISSPNATLDIDGTIKVTSRATFISNVNTLGNIITSINGFVGIGTPSPYTTLSITPTSKTHKITLFDNGNPDSHFGFGISNNQLNYHIINSTDSHVFYVGGKNSDGVELMRLAGNGRVGIGISNPQYSLDISGPVRITNGNLIVSNVNYTLGNILSDNNSIAFHNKIVSNYDININNTTNSLNSSTGSLVSYGGISINCSEESTSVTQGGSLTINGGASINKNLNIGGSVKIFNTQVSDASTASLMLSGGLTINTSENSLSLSSGGALTVLGGASINKNVYIGGTLTNSDIVYINHTSVSSNSSSGSLVVKGGVSINCSSNATSFTEGGSLTINGGTSIMKNLYIGENNYVNGSTNYYIPTGQSIVDVINFRRVDNYLFKLFSLNINNKDFCISRYDINGVEIEKSLCISHGNGIISLFNNTPSTSSSMGSLVLQGGISVNNNTDSVSLANGGAMTIAGGASINKKLKVGDTVNIYSNHQSNNVSSGALIVGGGVGIGGNLNVKGNTTILGNLYVQGSSSLVESSTVEIKDNILLLNSGPTGTKDSGVIIKRFQDSNNIGDGDIIKDATYVEFELPQQGTLDTNKILLPSNASNINNYYNNWWILIVDGGSPAGQVRKISSYNGTSKIADIDGYWNENNQPIVDTTVRLFNRSFVGIIFNETRDVFELCSVLEDPVNTIGTISSYMPLTLDSAIITSSIQSIYTSGNLIGSIVTDGGISIKNTTNASSISSGGTFTTLGGAAIGKKLYVGDELYVKGINISPNNNDQTQFDIVTCGNSNLSFNNIPNLYINTTNSWSFEIYLTIRYLDQTETPINFSNYHIRGIINNTNVPEITSSYVGDNLGLEFNMTPEGQLQYKNPTYSDFSHFAMKWRVVTI